MRIVRFVVPLAILASLVASQPCLAKRAAPELVTPVVIGATTFNVPSSPVGLVEAVDTKTGATLWTKQIYVTRYDPTLERDVQDRFITGLRAAEGGLVITVEGGGEYFHNPNTLEVTRHGKRPKPATPPTPKLTPAPAPTPKR